MSDNSNLEHKFSEMMETLQIYFKNAAEAYDNDNLSNLAINARSSVEQLCNMTFIQYTFNEGVTIKDKIDYLEQYKIITPEEAAVFHKIRLAGNAAAHGDIEGINDIKKTYAMFSDMYDHIAKELDDFLKSENKPQHIGNKQEQYCKQYKFSDYVYGFSPNQTILVDGDTLHIESKAGGTINIGTISRVSLVDATAFKRGNLYFIGSNGIHGVTWSTIKDNKKMNENAHEIRDYVFKKANEIRNAKTNQTQTVNNITTPLSPADEIKKLKELVDLGILTQEEFDMKKKELLNL